jgi:hypothetical protein
MESTNTDIKPAYFKLSWMLVLGLATITIMSCVPGGGTYSDGPAGFFSGVWHGWIAPISLILGLFNDNLRVYEINNTGWWYDFGFYMAVISGFGGLSLARRNSNK